MAATTPPLWWAYQIFTRFDRGTVEMQFTEKVSWIPAFNIEYYMGIDGISVTMVLLTALPAAAVAMALGTLLAAG